MNETMRKTSEVLEAYQVAVDQLIEDLAFATGTPRDVLIVRYLRGIADVIESR